MESAPGFRNTLNRIAMCYLITIEVLRKPGIGFRSLSDETIDTRVKIVSDSGFPKRLFQTKQAWNWLMNRR